MLIRKVEIAEMQRVKELFLEYAKEHTLDLCFQNFDNELKELPGIYAEPSGCILVLADENDFIQGVIALKDLGNNVSEMKRLFVVPKLRKYGYGRKLAEALLLEAKKKSYKEMKLDTLKELKPAIALYKSLGFVKSNPYYSNPIETVLYFKKSL